MRLHPIVTLVLLGVFCVFTGCGTSADDPATAKADAASLVAAMVAKDDATYDRLGLEVEAKMKRLEDKGTQRETYRLLLAKELNRHAKEREVYAASRWPAPSIQPQSPLAPSPPPPNPSPPPPPSPK